MLGLAGVAAATILGFASLQDATPPQAPSAASRSAVPSQAEQEKALAALKAMHEKEYSKTASLARRQLAKLFLDLARKDDLNAAEYFVLLNEARELSVLGRDLPSAIDAITRLNAAFAIDRVEKCLDAIARVSSGLTEGETLLAGAAGAAALDETYGLVAARDFPSAARVIECATRILRIAKKPELKLAFKVLDEELGYTLRIGDARKRFKANPDDGAANLDLGTLYCFSEGNLDIGLRLLARATPGELRDLAAADVSNPTTPEEQKALGDRWAAWGKTQDRPALVQALHRARYWYLRASQQREGFSKVELDKVVGALDQSLAEAERSSGVDAEARVKAVEEIAARVLGAELVINGDCEQRTGAPGIRDWEIVAGNWQPFDCATWKLEDDLSGAYFFGPNCQENEVELRQDVDIAAVRGDVDAGTILASVRGRVVSFRQRDGSQAQIVVEFLDGGGEPTGEPLQSEPTYSPDWLPVQLNGPVPAAARAIRIRLKSVRKAGRNNDGFFDNLSLALQKKDRDD